MDSLALDARDETIDWEMTRGSTRGTASHESACGRISLELPFRHSRHLCTAVDDRSASLTRATTPNPPIRCVVRRPGSALRSGLTGELRMETAAAAAAAAVAEQPAMKFGKEQLKDFIERVER